MLDIYPFGTTSPIYVKLAGRPVRHAADADYFLRWLARLTTAVSAHGGTPEDDRREILRRISQAEEEFTRRRPPTE